jgi:uncharacterized phage protein (TIGR02220 family)
MRVHKTKDYTVMSNTHFREREMSLKAKGLLSLMFSLPDTWDYSVAGLVAICKENETAINSTLKELKKFGYLSVTKLMPDQTKSGRIEYVYDIYETPTERENLTEEKQGVENQGVVSQAVENPIQLSTKVSNTKKSNTNISIIKEIIDYLNEKAETKYKASTAKTVECITARLKEGFTIEDFKTVIDKKTAEWKGTDFEQYLRPTTLFGTKFEGYLNAKINTQAKKQAPTIMDDYRRLQEKIDNGGLFGGNIN